VTVFKHAFLAGIAAAGNRVGAVCTGCLGPTRFPCIGELLKKVLSGWYPEPVEKR
jgi:hypothetical protein